jgi:G:T/U-mismatch repair DNA glycosylase
MGAGRRRVIFLYRRHAWPTLPGDYHLFARLPSTSPANAAMRLEEKVQAWSVLKNVLS